MSAGLASPAGRGRVPRDKVRALQHTLYRAAKAGPGRRFHTLMGKVLRRDVLWRAWVAVRRNNGAPGIDKLALDAVEEYGIDRFLAEVETALREGRYRPLPARRVLIPKRGQPGAWRSLAIASVRDRVVQAALKIGFEPVFEADMLPCSFGFRPKRSVHDALLLSPLLCNIYLHQIDRVWEVREHGVLVRFADDGVPRTLKEGSV